MKLRKIFLFLGLLLAPLSGGTIYYLYHLQTKEISILQIKSNLDYIVEPGTKITNELLETKRVLQKNLPNDPMLPGSIDENIYASKYLYSSDPLLASKVTNQPLTYKLANQRIVSIKPLDLGLMDLMQIDDLITIKTPNFTLTNIKIVGASDSTGNIQSIIPPLMKLKTNANSLLDIANSTPAQVKSADHLMVLVTEEEADLLSKFMLSDSKDLLTVIFEKRPSLPDAN